MTGEIGTRDQARTLGAQMVAQSAFETTHPNVDSEQQAAFAKLPGRLGAGSGS
ncbi:MAG: hypothetical protein ACT4PP_06470 [Sporichthyaceae bacterium]